MAILKKIVLNFSLIIILFLLFSIPCKAANYYVSPTGSDTSSGTQTSPWKTIQKAANTLVAGDTVIVNEGTYNEIVDETTSGTASNMIRYAASGIVTIKGFNLRGNYLEINGFTVTPTDCGSWNGAIHVAGSYCLVQNNTVKDSSRQGIVIYQPSTGCTIRGNTVARAQVNGIFVSGTNHLIENNDISDIQDHMGSCSLWEEANAIEFHGSGHIFRGNYIHDFYKAHQNGQPHVDAFQTFSGLANGDSAIKDTVIERNHIFMGNTTSGVLEEAISGVQGFHAFMIEGISSDKVTNITIKNNLIESWGGWNGNPGNINNIKIYNNIWRSSLHISSSYWPTAIEMNGVTTFEIYNNIIIDFSYAHIEIDSASSGGSYDYNLMWNSDGTNPGLSGYTTKSHDKYKINPLFVSNFNNLQSNSPCIDAGVDLKSLGVTNDFDGTPRPQGTGYDIGAYEFTPPFNHCTPLGDIDCSTKVNILDLSALLAAFGSTTNKQADLDDSGKVNMIDLSILLQNFGK